MKRLGENITRDEMVGALYSSTDERAVRLLQMMGDPAFANFSLGRLCQRVGLSSIDLLDAFRRYRIDQGIIEMSRRAPEIMATSSWASTASLGAAISFFEILEPT